MKNIMITAHSGCEGTPDNSLESIRKGAELGADSVEIDIRMAPDGRICLTHNELEDYETAVPLETALQLIAAYGVGVNCDLKEEKLLYPVLEAAEAAGIAREKLFFSGSVKIEDLRNDPSIIRRARIFLNVAQIFSELSGETFSGSWEDAGVFFDEHIEGIAALVKELGVECINPNFRIFTHERIEAALSHGIQLSLWTANEPEDQERLLHEDLVNMTTRSVESALRLRKEIRGY